MGILIDTSVLVDRERRGADAADHRDEPAGVAAVTVSELLHGAARADSAERRARREAFVESVIAWLPVVDFDLEVARRYASLWAQTAAQGTPVGAHDLMIAATAQLLGWRVWTRDPTSFDRIPGTVVVTDEGGRG